MNLLPTNITEQQANIARLTAQIENLRRELAYERYLFRRKLIRQIFFMLRLETEVDMEISFPSKPSDSAELCSICLEPLCRKDVRELTCQHQFHQKCIDRWIHNQPTCPMCRDPIDVGNSFSAVMLQLFQLLTEEIA